MNKLFRTIIIIFLAVFVCTGCQEPVGDFDGGGGNGGGSGGSNDFILLKPNRQLYTVNSIFDSKFKRETDYVVYFADNGPMQKLDPLDPELLIEIKSSPSVVGANVDELVDRAKDFEFEFLIPGRYTIVATYQGKTDEYQVEVQGEFSDKGEGYDFGGIKWLD